MNNQSQIGGEKIAFILLKHGFSIEDEDVLSAVAEAYCIGHQQGKEEIGNFAINEMQKHGERLKESLELDHYRRLFK